MSLFDKQSIKDVSISKNNRREKNYAKNLLGNGDSKWFKNTVHFLEGVAEEPDIFKKPLPYPTNNYLSFPNHFIILFFYDYMWSSLYSFKAFCSFWRLKIYFTSLFPLFLQEIFMICPTAKVLYCVRWWNRGTSSDLGSLHSDGNHKGFV